MLRLLLDEHLSPEIAKGLRLKSKSLGVESLATWEGGRFLGLSDEAILKETAAQKRTLVTYDLRTIPPLLKTWIESGRDHAGVIFIDHKTIPSSNFGALIRALQKLSRAAARWDWKNRVCFLCR
jgi:hypothetical protein